MFDFVTSWTAAHQAPLSMAFPRQKYLSELPFPSPGDLPDSGIEPRSLALQTDSLLFEPAGKPFVMCEFYIQRTLEWVQFIYYEWLID